MNGRVGIGLHRYLTQWSFKQAIKFPKTDGLECCFIGSKFEELCMGRGGRDGLGREEVEKMGSKGCLGPDTSIGILAH